MSDDLYTRPIITSSFIIIQLMYADLAKTNHVIEFVQTLSFCDCP